MSAYILCDRARGFVYRRRINSTEFPAIAEPLVAAHRPRRSIRKGIETTRMLWVSMPFRGCGVCRTPATVQPAGEGYAEMMAPPFLGTSRKAMR